MEMTASRNRMLASIAGVYLVFVASKGFGLLRDVLIAYKLGTSSFADALLTGLWLPLTVVSIVNTAVTPSIMRQVNRGDAKSTATVFSAQATLLAFPLLALAAASEGILGAAAPHLEGPSWDAALGVVRWGCAIAFVLALNQVMAAVGHGHGFFVVPKVFVLAQPIGACLGLLLMQDPAEPLPVVLTMLGVVAMAHVGYHLWARGHRLRFRFQRSSFGALRGQLRTTLPYALGCIGVNTALLLLLRELAALGAGTPSLLFYADRVWMVVGTAAASGTLVVTARSEQGPGNALGPVLAIATSFCLFLGFVVILRFPALEFAFQRGAFDARATAALAATLIYYGPATALAAIGYHLEYRWIAQGHPVRAMLGGVAQLTVFIVLCAMASFGTAPALFAAYTAAIGSRVGVLVVGRWTRVQSATVLLHLFVFGMAAAGYVGLCIYVEPWLRGLSAGLWRLGFSGVVAALLGLLFLALVWRLNIPGARVPFALVLQATARLWRVKSACS